MDAIIARMTDGPGEDPLVDALEEILLRHRRAGGDHEGVLVDVPLVGEVVHLDRMRQSEARRRRLAWTSGCSSLEVSYALPASGPFPPVRRLPRRVTPIVVAHVVRQAPAYLTYG